MCARPLNRLWRSRSDAGFPRSPIVLENRHSSWGAGAMERHRKNLVRNVLRIGTIFIALTAACFGATAQTTLDAMMQREIVVGTKEAAPFSMKNADGNWVGISIDLWRRIADEKKIRYRIV